MVRLRQSAGDDVTPGDPAAGGVTDEELARFCRDRLARHKVPKIWHRTDVLTLTGSGKVMKHVLREQILGG